jgi:hypothetical protein
MGLTFAQAMALGIGHLHPDHPQNWTGPAGPQPPPAVPRPRAGEDGLNKTERRFRDRLQGSLEARRIRRYLREPLKFRLGGRCWYCPDYLVLGDPHRPAPACCEVKGWLREDAAVKIKVAAHMYPEFRWLLIYYERKQGWQVHEVAATGIRPHPVHVAWIHEEGP